MTVVTEADLRSQLRHPTMGASVVVPADATFTPSARDFVKAWQLLTRTAPEPGDATGALSTSERAGLPEFARASTFPVKLTGDVPACSTCGQQITRKGDNLTQLNAHHMVRKNHPRIRLRGRVDSLHATVLMAEHHARGEGLEEIATDLAVLAAYCRELTSAEYNERSVAPLSLPGWDEGSIHRATHDPDGVLGVPHATIDGSAPALVHWLNIARTDCREVELLALDAFESQHDSWGAGIIHALNRLSSAFYLLQLRLAKEAAR